MLYIFHYSKPQMAQASHGSFVHIAYKISRACQNHGHQAATISISNEDLITAFAKISEVCGIHFYMFVCARVWHLRSFYTNRKS